tara:strand:+ start:2547 stop:3413 length:867 start_codon:yes stop_codon:yes gene_type:complete
LKSQKDIFLGENFFCILAENQEVHSQEISRDIDSTYIQFHFVLRGSINFLFNDGAYQLEIEERKYLMLYNPMRDLPLNINLNGQSTLISILISIDKFHQLFSEDSHNITFLSKENINQRYYNENKISKSISIVLNQMLNDYDVNTSNNSLYLKAKTYELFSLIFQKDIDKEIEKCPFIMNDDHIMKIKLAKDIIIAEYDNPPTLVELSNKIDLSLKKLKQGFKEVYGSPVFQYLLEYKMNLSKQLLAGGNYNVNEVSMRLGYSTASHFIAAFKRRFGITPKQYIMHKS